MRPRRSIAFAALFVALLVLPISWARSQGTKKGKDDIPAPRQVVDPKDVEELKKSVAALKAKAEDDAKKVAALEKSAGDAKTALAESQKASAEALKKAEAAEKAVADAKAPPKKDGEEKKDPVGEKLAALEKSAGEIPAIKSEVFDSTGASKVTAARQRGDTAWMLTASAFVLLMVPGLALFYGGMVRRKNVLATMMQSMAALAVVGVYWIAFGYALAFGPSAFTISAMGVENGGLVGWSWDLVFLKGIEASTYLPAYDVPVYVHVMFQGMFAIITPALISGAIAERIRFWPFCLFMILWVTFVYCPLAHMVWAFDWFDTTVPAGKQGVAAIGFLGKMGALDFAGGTVVHIAAGMAGLACCLVLGKRAGYPKMVAHPNSMVLTLLGAGLLWFGWFGFNGGSAVNGTNLAGSAFAATQAAAAAAGLGWMLVEWLHKGKPTALGLASGIVAGLVAVTPASGFVYMGGGVCIGLAAAVICYIAVALKNSLGYDDSLDAFGVHAVGGFVGAVLTGVFCSQMIQSASADGLFAFKEHRAKLEELKKDDGKMIKDAKKAAEDADAAAKAKEAAASQLEALTKAKDEAEKKFADAPVGKREAETKAFTEAKDKLKEVAEPIDKAKDEAAVKAESLKKLEDDLKALQALADKQDADGKGSTSQVFIQLKAASISVIFAFVISLALCALTQAITLGNFKTNAKGESEGLDRSEHGEVGFDFSAATESVAVVSAEPRAAAAPKGNGRFDVQLTGATAPELMKVWTELCQPKEGPGDADFLAVYPYVTTVKGTTFHFRGGNSEEVAKRLAALFKKHLGKEVRAAKV
jgi:Amt family ammonium transporter